MRQACPADGQFESAGRPSELRATHGSVTPIRFARCWRDSAGSVLEGFHTHRPNARVPVRLRSTCDVPATSCGRTQTPRLAPSHRNRLCLATSTTGTATCDRALYRNTPMDIRQRLVVESAYSVWVSQWRGSECRATAGTTAEDHRRLALRAQGTWVALRDHPRTPPLKKIDLLWSRSQPAVSPCHHVGVQRCP